MESHVQGGGGGGGGIGGQSLPREYWYLLVLPVLFYEFLALALIRGLLPTLMLDFWGKWTYTVIGVIDTGKG